MKGIARPSARRLVLRCASSPMTDTQTVAWPRSWATSTSVTVTNPMAGAAAPSAVDPGAATDDAPVSDIRAGDHHALADAEDLAHLCATLDDLDLLRLE